MSTEYCVKESECMWRFVLINLQETCYTQVDQLIDGWFANSADALAAVGYTNECFGAWKLDFTMIPKEDLLRWGML